MDGTSFVYITYNVLHVRKCVSTQKSRLITATYYMLSTSGSEYANVKRLLETYVGMKLDQSDILSLFQRSTLQQVRTIEPHVC
jgi:hypothetical protein